MSTLEDRRVPRGRRLRTALVVVAMLMLVALVVHEIALNQRVAELETAAARRDAADPLMPFECRFGGAHGDLLGAARETPCPVSFQRLLDAPQQFQGRWVEVQGIYREGIEKSALYPLDWTEPAEGRWASSEHALWVGVKLQYPPKEGRVVAVGRFRRGPTGHLAAYFAELANE